MTLLSARIEGEVLAPGIYRLQQDVLNPRADRRVRQDWRRWRMIPRGTRFQIREIDGEWKGRAPTEIVLARGTHGS